MTLLLPLLLALSATTPEGPTTTPPAADGPTVAQPALEAVPYEDPTTGAQVVIPPGWHVRTELKGDTRALFVTRQNIDTEGGFLTGFSLNRVDGFRARNQVAPSAYAASFASGLAERHPISRTSSMTLRSGLTVHEVRLVDESRLPPTKLLYLVVADDTLDTLQIAWFETPEPTAETEWPHGDRILNAFLQGIARSPND